MTPLSDCKGAEEALETSLSHKRLFVVTGQEKDISPGKSWRQGTTWHAEEETWDEWAVRAAEDTVDFHLFIELHYLF